MKTSLSVSKYPAIPIPKYASNFTKKEIDNTKKLYKTTDEGAKLILKEKFYGADCPFGFESWKEYWSQLTFERFQVN